MNWGRSWGERNRTRSWSSPILITDHESRILTMFFRKRMKVPEFVECLCSQLLTEDGIFLHEAFFDEYSSLLTESGFGHALEGNERGTDPSSSRNLFINHLIGTFLWLIKYRSLSNMFNSPRKMAYLDLSFDTVVPQVVEKRFSRYQTVIIKETYDAMDIACKKAYSGELQKDEKPRFLVSPLWARNPDPHPFQVAAGLFMEIVGQKVSIETMGDLARQASSEALEKRFLSMTQEAADTARKVNVT